MIFHIFKGVGTYSRGDVQIFGTVFSDDSLPLTSYHLPHFQAKDTQIGVLKVRLAEADSELLAQNGNIGISFLSMAVNLNYLSI